MSNIDKQTREELRKRYTPPEIPKCSICGAELSIQRCGGGEPTVYACGGYEDDPEHPGMARLAAGRGIADSHYEKSRYIDWKQGGDSDVVALLDELEAKGKRIAELEARQVTLPEVRITVAESRRRNMTWRELGAYNEGADVAVEKISKVLSIAGIRINGEG